MTAKNEKEQKKDSVEKLPCGEPKPRLKKVFMSGDIIGSKVIKDYRRKKEVADSRVTEMSLTDPKTMEHYQKKLDFEKQLAEATNKLSLRPEYNKKLKEAREKIDNEHESNLKKIMKKYTDIGSRTKAKKDVMMEYDEAVAEWGEEFKEYDEETQQLIQDTYALKELVINHERAIQERVKRDDEYFDLLEKAHDHYVEHFDDFFEMVYEPVDQEQLFKYGIDDMLSLVYHFFVECGMSSQKSVS